VIVSIGPVTSGAVRAAGLEVAAEAAVHTLDGLVAAVADVLSPS
jgi:uroporphyrinogen-III synthase